MPQGCGQKKRAERTRSNCSGLGRRAREGEQAIGGQVLTFERTDARVPRRKSARSATARDGGGGPGTIERGGRGPARAKRAGPREAKKKIARSAATRGAKRHAEHGASEEAASRRAAEPRAVERAAPAREAPPRNARVVGGRPPGGPPGGRGLGEKSAAASEDGTGEADHDGRAEPRDWSRVARGGPHAHRPPRTRELRREAPTSKVECGNVIVSRASSECLTRV